MAIDTRRKRQSAAQVGCPLPPSLLPSSMDGFARQQAAWTYGGIAVSPPTPTGNIVEDRIAEGFQNLASSTVVIGGFN